MVYRGLQGGSVVKNPPSFTGGTIDSGLMPGLGRFPGGGNGNPSCILVWKILWAEEPGRLYIVRGVTKSRPNRAYIYTHGYNLRFQDIVRKDHHKIFKKLIFPAQMSIFPPSIWQLKSSPLENSAMLNLIF